MKVTGQTYSYYFTREYLPPSIFFILCIIITLLLIPVQLLFKRSSILKRHFKAGFLIKHVFSSMLNKQRNRNGKTVYTILDYKVPKSYKVMMLAIAISLIGVAGKSFWSVFLFGKSNICSTDPKLACFPAQPNLTTPRLDCSDTSYLEDNNITSIICYRYGYNLSGATGAALGIIVIDALFIITITVILLKLSNGSEWTKCRAVLTVSFQITIVALIPVYIAVLVYLFPTAGNHTIENQIFIIIQNAFVLYTILYSTVLFPWWSFKKMKGNEEDDKDNDEESNGEYRRVTGTSIPI